MNETDILEKLANAVDKYNVTPERVQKAINFLIKYGYLVKNKTLTLQDIIEGVIAFQQFFGRDGTGLLDPKTLSLLEAPRCPLPDIMRNEDGNIQNASNYGWNTHSLTYYIQKYVGDEITRDRERQITRELADSVTTVCNLKFTEVDNAASANLIMTTGRGASMNLDGPSGVLGYQTIPTKSTRQATGVLDEDEFWREVKSQRQGIVFRAVKLHETFCHGVGLLHINDPSDILNPYYSPNIYDLTPRTIQNLVNMYGPPVGNPMPVPTPVPNPIPQPTPSPGERTLTMTFTGDVKQIIIPGYTIIKRGLNVSIE